MSLPERHRPALGCDLADSRGAGTKPTPRRSRHSRGSRTLGSCSIHNSTEQHGSSDATTWKRPKPHALATFVQS